MERVWRAVVRLAGGVHEIAGRTVCIHDRGVFIANHDRIVRWEWRL